MASLTDTERRKIVQRLACFETPAEVVEWASENLKKDLSIQQVCHYDPTRSGETSGRWKELFKETRREFLEDLDTIPLSHRAVRLREIQRLYEHLTRGLDRDGDGEIKDTTEAARLLKQAAKEVGEKFTNVERREHDMKGFMVQIHPPDND